VLSQLARHYAVCDDWFASVPSQTNPNRAFLLCGTSEGMVNNGFLEDLQEDPWIPVIEKAMSMKLGDDRIEATTIFNALDSAGKDWAVFWQTSYAPQKISTLIEYATAIAAVIPQTRIFAAVLAWLGALGKLDTKVLGYLRGLTAGDLESSYTWRLFPQIQSLADAASNFQRLDDFHTRARNGTLPAFSYIEPYWSISRSTTSNGLLQRLVTGLGNDYHPPSNLLLGEQLVKEVYTSLISNTDAWHKTLLLITFDEFVGAFDHVTDHLADGSVQAPWGSGSPRKGPEEGFKFDRLGARVPTILVSPYVGKGTVFRSTQPVPYDHTSVIATTMNWIGAQAHTSDFGLRAANAPTFDNVLTLSQPRTDEADPKALPFLDTERIAGDPLHYGDSFWLQNQSGDYLTTAYPTMKMGGGGSLLPQSGIDLLADIGVAAYFPRYAEGETTTVTFVSHSVSASPGPPAQVCYGDVVRIVSREPQLGSRDVLGIWSDAGVTDHYCYYYDEYIDGNDALAQAWVVQNPNDPSSKDGVKFGGPVRLVSQSADYNGQALSRVTGLFRTSNWITTRSGGDSWTVVPAPPHIGAGSRVWEQAPGLLNVWASAQGGSRGLQVWGADSNSLLCSTYQDKPNGTWSAWMTGWAAGGPSRSATPVTAAVQNHSEVVQIWAIGFGGPQRQLWSRYQTSPGGDWTNWFVWDGAPAYSAIAACREGGSRCIRLWCIDANSQLRCNYLDKPGGTWVGWSPPGWSGAPENLREVCAVLQGDGTIRVWVTAVAPGVANLYTSVQSSPGGDQWSGWTSVAGFDLYATLAACQTGDGGVQVWALDGRRVLRSSSQPVPGGDWTPWDPPVDQGYVNPPGWHGTPALMSVTAAQQPGGEAGIWVVDGHRKLHYKAQTGGEWGEWNPPFAAS
jgi:phospholipase C